VAKLLLINPSYYRTYGSNEGGLGNPIYPVMALACLAATARHAGHEVKIVDMSYRKYDPHFIRSMLRAEQPDVLGITATTPLANQMRDISYIAKEVSAELHAALKAHPAAEMSGELAGLESSVGAMIEAASRGDEDAVDRHRVIYREYRISWLERIDQFAVDPKRVRRAIHSHSQ